MKGIPMIKSVMTPFPYSVDMSDKLSAAREMMVLHDIGHLPVKDDGQLVSVITEYDIDQIAGMNSNVENADSLFVRDGCEREVYIVDLTERLDAVLLHMANTHIDCTLAVKHGRLAGIFTMRDACRCFAEWLRSQYLADGGHDAA